MDPLAEKYYNISPYAYCANNPLRFTDPTGMDPVDESQRKPAWMQFVEGIKNLFSINVDTSSPETIDASKQQLDKNQEIVQQATELINTVAEMISAVNPIGSTVTTTFKAANGQEVTAGDVAFSAMEVVPAVGSTKSGAKVAKNLVKIVAKESDVIVFSSKFGSEVVEGISNFLVKDGKLYLNQLHLQGSSPGKVGRTYLWDMAKDLGRQHNAQEVIIQGGKRTTGKYKGTVPSPITIKVD